MADGMMGNKDEGPRRIQLRRTKGWRMPENTVKACRPGPLGNPWSVKAAMDLGYSKQSAVLMCVKHFRDWVSFRFDSLTNMLENGDYLRRVLFDALPTARGKNLGCWCGLCDRHKDGRPLAEQCADCDPCHIDVIGELLANQTPDPNTPHTKGGL